MSNRQHERKAQQTAPNPLGSFPSPRITHFLVATSTHSAFATHNTRAADMAGPTLPRRAGRPSRSLDTLHHPTPIRAPPSRGGLLALPSSVRLAPHPRSRSRPPPPVCGLLAHAIAPHCTLWSVLLLRPGRSVNHHRHTAHRRPLRVKSTSHRFDFLSPRKLHHHRGRGHGWERDGCTRHGSCTDAGLLWLLSIPSPHAYILLASVK